VEYKAIAPLTITPTPAVTIRVLMLFKGLSAPAALAWNSVKPHLSEGPGIWKEVIGGSSNLMGNYNHFRALELAAMEVY
jgi:hypothetical protein